MPNGKKAAPPGLEPREAPDDVELSDQERIFVEEYLKHFNGVRAAMAAGYSPHNYASAGATASRLLKRVRVQKAMAAGTQARAKRIQVTADDIAEELRLMAFARMGRFARVDNGRVMFADTSELEAEGLDAAIQSYTETTTKDGGSVGVRLHDKIRALELLRKHLGMDHDDGSEGDDRRSRGSESARIREAARRARKG